MDTQDYLNLVNGKKGQFIKLAWKRDVKTAAAFKALKLEKQTITVARTGIEYDNLASTKEGREDGTLPAENAGLPWGADHIWNAYPYVTEYRGKHYARIYGAKNSIPQVTWFLNGVKIEKSVAVTFLTPSDKKRETERTSTYECFDVKMENLFEA